MPDFPSTARFLTEEERLIAVKRLTDDAGVIDEDSTYDRWYCKRNINIICKSCFVAHILVLVAASLIAAFKEPNLYLSCLLLWFKTTSVSFNNYSPTLVKSLGFGSTTSLLLNAPPFSKSCRHLCAHPDEVLKANYIVWAFIFSIPMAWWSDRIRCRSIPILVITSLASVGCILPLATTNIAARYVGLFLLTGDFAATALVLGWIVRPWLHNLVMQQSITDMVLRADIPLPGTSSPSCCCHGLYSGICQYRSIGWSECAELYLHRTTVDMRCEQGYFFVADNFGPTYRGSFGIILAMVSRIGKKNACEHVAYGMTYVLSSPAVPSDYDNDLRCAPLLDLEKQEA